MRPVQLLLKDFKKQDGIENAEVNLILNEVTITSKQKSTQKHVIEHYKKQAFL